MLKTNSKQARLNIQAYIKNHFDREKYLDKVGYSVGVYGLNGGLLQGHESGTLYAITARTSALFIYF